MVNANKLRAAIVGSGESQRSVARKIGISENAFYSKVRRGVFTTDDISKIMDVLSMSPDEAIRIFLLEK